MNTGREAQESGVDRANVEAQAAIDKDVQENTKEQADQRGQALTGVAGERRGWTTEQQKKLAEHSAAADEQMGRVDTQVVAKRREADRQAASEIDDGNKKAAAAKREGEAKAEAERKKGEEESSGGVLGWIADKARAAFNAIKSAIKAAFDWAREQIRKAIDWAIEKATQIIDAARDAIVSAIRAIGDALLELGDVLLAWFPSLHERYRKKIHELVDRAVAKVDELADALKEKVKKALNALAAAIDSVLAVYENALLAAVDFVQSAVEGAIEKARAFINMLEQWGALIADIASAPLQWLSNLGSSAYDGVRNHLWKAFKCQAKEWVGSKFQDVVGVPVELIKMLARGGIAFAQIVSMVWEGLISAIPGILIELVIEQLVKALVPALGAIMAIIDTLRAAWSTLKRIIAAFEKFFAFLRAVKAGNAGRQFAELLAMAAIVVIDFLSNFLVKKLIKPAKPIGGRLAELGRKIMARLSAVGKAVKRGARRAVGAIKASAKKAAAVVKKAAVALKQSAAKAGRAIAKVAGRVGQTVKRGARRVTAAVRKSAGRAMRVIEKRFPRVARILKKGAGLVRRVTRRVRHGWRRARAWVRRKRAQYRRRREQRKRDALQRAQRELPPRLRRMLNRGVSRARLWLTLQGWRVLYRLRVLALRSDGENAKVVAANSPEVDLLTQIIQTRGRVLEDIFQHVAKDIMKDREVIAGAEDIMKQRRGGKGTLERPLELREGYGGAPAAKDIQELSILGGPPPGSVRAVPTSPEMEKAMRTALNKGTAAPGVEFLQLAPGVPAAREAPLFGDFTPLRTKVGGVQTYQSEYNRPAPADPVAFAAAVFHIQGGQTPPPGIWDRLSESEKALAVARSRLSQVEAGRATPALTSERLSNYLAMTPVGEDGKPLRSYQQRVDYRVQPMAGRGAPERSGKTAMARGWAPTPGVPQPERPPTPRSIAQGEVHRFLVMHLNLARDWLRIQILTDPNYFNSLEQAEKYVDEHMRGHLRSVLFAERTSTGAGIFEP